MTSAAGGQATDDEPAVPSRTAGRSGAAAALLSFIFPGLGQGYLGRRRAALLFALPVVFLLTLVIYQLRDGVLPALERLLDPWLATGLLLAIVASGVWRAISVLNAGLGAGRTKLSLATTVALVMVIGLSHAMGASLAGELVSADTSMFSGDPLDELAAAALRATPEPSAQLGSSGSPAVNGASGATPDPLSGPSPSASNSPGPGYGDVYDEPDDPGGDIIAGVPPFQRVELLGGLDDGLVNVLIVGIDWKPGRDHALTDTMIVVSVNQVTGDVYMFSFPRDSASFPVYTGGTFNGRLNSFANYARHHPETFPAGAMRSLSDEIGYLLGIPIDYYASVSIPGFADVVDALGGVTIYNEHEIADERFGFFMPAGRQRLDGATALQWVRSRHGQGNNDFVRAQRQQQMLVALRREILKPDNLLRLPRLVRAISHVLNTDFPPDQVDEMLRLADRVAEKPTDSWVFSWPGWADHPLMSETGGRWIITLDLQKIARLSVRLFGDKSLYGR